MNVETTLTPPPAADEEEGDDRSARIYVGLIRPDEAQFDAGVQLFGSNAEDPAKIADAVLGAALSMASLAGPEVSWAVVQRLARYQGGSS